MDENQHWVPKFLIRNFADTDGRVFCLSIQEGTITKPPPKYASARVGFNEFLINERAVSYEHELERIETRAAPVLRRIISARSAVGLSVRHRRRVADFMASQSFRTEAFYEGLGLDTPREQFGPIFEQLWRSALLVSSEIERRHWAVLSINNDDAFYLGDHPVVLQSTENPSAAGQLGFDINGVEAFLPLSPKCALYMPCASTSHQIVSGYRDALSIRKGIRSSVLAGKLAPGMASFSEVAERTIKSAGPLARALMQGSSIPAVPEHVENLNYLQCLWAHSAVYSNRRDFSFAMRVFRENPQYRKPIGTAVHYRWPTD